MRPKTVLVIAGAVGVASLVLTFFTFEFQPDRNELLGKNLPWNQWFLDWQHSFPGHDDLFVIVDAGASTNPADRRERRAAAERIVDQLGPALEAADHVEGVIWGFSRDQYSPRAVRLLAMNEFGDRLAQLADSQMLLNSPTWQVMIASIATQLRSTEQSVGTGGAVGAGGAGVGRDDQGAERDRKIAASLRDMAALIDAIGQRLEATPPADDHAQPTLGALVEHNDADDVDFEYLTPDSRFFFLRVTPVRNTRSLNEYATAIREVRRMIAEQVGRLPADSGTTIGLTGIPVIEMDETDVAVFDSTIASILATTLILAMLIVAFASWRTPLLAIISLMFGIAWSFGWLSLTVGHLQVISVVFTVILLGLGISYGIHLASCYELVRHNHPRGVGGFIAAMRQSMETVGPAIITGAVTTAAAFITTLFTDFRGVAEMGLIAAGGVILCLIAMFTVFPALMRLHKRKHKHIKPMADRSIHFFEERWVMPFVRWPKLTLMIAGVLTVGSVFALSDMRFDFDLLKLFPSNVPSIEWQKTLSDAGRPIWFGVSVCEDIEQARKRANVLRRLKTVQDVGGIGLLFPRNENQKIDLLKQTRQQIGQALDLALRQTAPGAPPTDAPQVNPRDQFILMQLALGANLSKQMPDSIRAALEHLQKTLTRVIAVIDRLPAAQRPARYQRVQNEFAIWRGHTARRIDATLDTKPLQISDLPKPLLAPYIEMPHDDNGDAATKPRVVLEVYPSVPPDVPSMLDPAFLPGYVTDMESIDGHVTGAAPQIYRSGVLIKESYQWAGLYALLTVFVLVWIDFRHIDDAVLALVPVTIGFAITFGVMWLVGMNLNPANIIVLPLMFGIGVDAGVHVIHRYRASPNARPLGLTSGTGKGISITSFATMIGFGTLMLARHRGVSSLGFVLTVGIGLTMLACWTVMPAWLELRQRHHEKQNKPAPPSRT